MNDWAEHFVQLYPTIVKLEYEMNRKLFDDAAISADTLVSNAKKIRGMIPVAMKVDNHFEMIRHWGYQRNLIEGTTSSKQLNKLMEEIGELAHGINKNRREEIIDGIGDAVVVLTIMAAQEGLFIEDCISMAYEVIKDRKGRMVNGIFVKEEDLVQTNAGL